MDPSPPPSSRGRVRALLLAAAKQRTAEALTLRITEDSAPSLFAPFSPSPTSVIEAVWTRLAQERVSLHADDLLVDLGCGDGRWLVSGVQQFGCHAMGIELDPALVRTAKQAVHAAGLQDRIDVVEADIITVPIRRARLVIVYAFAESLHGIREYLTEQLAENALVLSIGFRVPDWKPRWSERVGALRWYFYEMQSLLSVIDHGRDHHTITTTPTAARGAA